MEQTINIPIQMICYISTQGALTPIRFRFEDDEHQMITVNIDSVLSHKDTSFNGIREIEFVCRAEIAEIETMFILKFNIDSHKWIMFKKLN